MESRVGLGVVASAILVAVYAGVCSAQSADANVTRSGPWLLPSTEGHRAQAAQSWALDATLDLAEGTLSGEVVIDGSPLVHVGTLDARIDGERVIGTVTDEAGNHVANVTGQLDEYGASGKFADRTGGVGSWSFRGPLPRAAEHKESQE